MPTFKKNMIAENLKLSLLYSWPHANNFNCLFYELSIQFYLCATRGFVFMNLYLIQITWLQGQTFSCRSLQQQSTRSCPMTTKASFWAYQSCHNENSKTVFGQFMPSRAEKKPKASNWCFHHFCTSGSIF